MLKKISLVALPVVLLGAILTIAAGFKNAGKLNTFKFRNARDVKEFFKYTPDSPPFISAHRGGASKGWPENCIPTFEHTLGNIHALLEFDPHYTKDSAVIVMHDATLDRTSNGTGKIADHTLQEIKALRLKDTEGNLTDYKVPTLDEVLEWAKGKTLMVMDMKDLPIADRVKYVQKHNAYNSTILMAYNIADAKKCYALDKNIVMEVMFNSMDKIKEFDSSGVPWQNVVVFVSQRPGISPEIFNEIHKRGAMCIMGTSFSHDLAYSKGEIKSIEELHKNYRETVAGGADIIEANMAIEAGTAIMDMQKTKLRSSSKAKFY